MDTITHEIRLANWKSIIEQCNSRLEGQTAKQWLAEHDISEKKYYYWLRKVRMETYDSMKDTNVPAIQDSGQITFAEIPFTSEENSQVAEVPFRADAVLKSGRILIGLSNTVSEPLLGRLLEVVTHAG